MRWEYSWSKLKQPAVSVETPLSPMQQAAKSMRRAAGCLGVPEAPIPADVPTDYSPTGLSTSLPNLTSPLWCGQLGGELFHCHLVWEKGRQIWSLQSMS